MFDAATHIDLTPHCSLSVRGAVVFFGAVCLGTFGIAGVATTMGEKPTSSVDLIRQADEKLYQAKHEGRNRVCSDPV